MCEWHSWGHALLLGQMDFIQCRYPTSTMVLSQSQIIHAIFQAGKAKIQKFVIYRCLNSWFQNYLAGFSCDKKGNSSLKEDLWCPVLNVMKIINTIKLLCVILTIFQKRNKAFCLTILCYYLQIPINGTSFWMLLLKKDIVFHASIHTETTSHYNTEAYYNTETEVSTHSLLQLKKAHKIKLQFLWSLDISSDTRVVTLCAGSPAAQMPTLRRRRATLVQWFTPLRDVRLQGQGFLALSAGRCNVERVRDTHTW